MGSRRCCSHRVSPVSRKAAAGKQDPLSLVPHRTVLPCQCRAVGSWALCFSHPQAGTGTACFPSAGAVLGPGLGLGQGQPRSHRAAGEQRGCLGRATSPKGDVLARALSALPPYQETSPLALRVSAARGNREKARPWHGPTARPGSPLPDGKALDPSPPAIARPWAAAAHVGAVPPFSSSPLQ